MARRSQRALQATVALPGGRAESATLDSAGDERASVQIVVFPIADGLFGFKLDDVSEIVRVPSSTCLWRHGA